MKTCKKLSVLLLVISTIFMVGCDASKIMETITKIADGIQQAIPKIKEVVDTVSNVVNNVQDVTNTANNDTNTAEQTNNNAAGTTVATANDQEDIGGGTVSTSVGDLPPLSRPNGRAEIERVFGARGTNQVTVQMAAGPNGATRSVTCHRLIAPRLKAVFDEIKSRGLSNLIDSYDGCFVNRNKRGGSNPSTHAWGIAVDINASANPMGSSRMTSGQAQLAEIFRRYGFYQLPNDPMHFQYCTGY